MNIRLDNFFENPTWMSAIVIVVFLIAQVIIVYLQTRGRKKDRVQNSDNSNKTVNAISSLSNKIQILLDKEVNTVNLQNAESVICSTLRKSEAIIKDEIRRVFFHNKRHESARQNIIKKALSATTLTSYNDNVNTLSKFYYKEKTLAEFLTNINQEDFFKGLLALVFNKSESNNTDLLDCIYYIESSFSSYITNAKSYYSNL